MKVAQLSLWVMAASLIGFGLAFGINPRFIETTGAALLTPASRFEIRSFYGGAELGFGVFFAIAALRPAWYRPALIAQVCGMGGLVLMRLVARLVDGPPGTVMMLVWALEVGGLVLGVIALRALPANVMAVPDMGRR